MIKRLFRTWLRIKMFYILGESCTNFEESFNWVYNSPIIEWKYRAYLCSYYKKNNSVEIEKLKSFELLPQVRKHGQMFLIACLDNTDMKRMK